MSAPLFHREPRGPLAARPPVVLSGGALRCEDLLAIAHGAPVRLRVERQLGYKHAKYVEEIILTNTTLVPVSF